MVANTFALPLKLKHTSASAYHVLAFCKFANVALQLWISAAHRLTGLSSQRAVSFWSGFICRGTHPRYWVCMAGRQNIRIRDKGYFLLTSIYKKTHKNEYFNFMLKVFNLYFSPFIKLFLCVLTQVCYSGGAWGPSTPQTQSLRSDHTKLNTVAVILKYHTMIISITAPYHWVRSPVYHWQNGGTSHQVTHFCIYDHWFEPVAENGNAETSFKLKKLKVTIWKAL